MVFLNTELRRQSGPFDTGIALIQGKESCGSPSSTRYRSRGKDKIYTVFNSAPYHEDLSAIRNFCTRCEWSLYRVSQEEWTKLRESVPFVELYRYNPKHLYPKLNGYGDNGHRKVWTSGVSTYCTPSVMPYSSTEHARQRDTAS